MFYLRVYHEILESLNFFFEDTPFLYNLSYLQMSGYYTILSNQGRIINREFEIASDVTKFEEAKYYTCVIMGNAHSYIFEDRIVSDVSNSYIRCLNLAWGFLPVDFYVDDPKLFSKVLVGDIPSPEYRQLPLHEVTVTVASSSIETLTFTPQIGNTYTVILTSNTLAVFRNIRQVSDVYQKDFDLMKYMGSWWQIAATSHFYDKGCIISRTFYTSLYDRIKVQNICYDEEGNIIDKIGGFAVSENPLLLTALTVSFPGVPQFSKGPNYLIHKTDYLTYALIGSPGRDSFYILGRSKVFSKTLLDNIINVAKVLGYDISKLKIAT